MKQELDNYDWKEAFGEDDAENRQEPMAIPGYNGLLTRFTREDVADIRHIQDGENDERDWMLVCQLNDGRWAHVRSWCDYTGWNCRSGVSVWVGDSYDTIIRLGLDDSAREAFGIPNMPIAGEVKEDSQ